MVEYRASSDPIHGDKLKSGAGRLVGIVALFVALLASLLFVSGFWNPRPTSAALPPVASSTEAVAKDRLAGTMKLPVDPPSVQKPHN
jgi:hypothetical protein